MRPESPVDSVKSEESPIKKIKTLEVVEQKVCATKPNSPSRTVMSMSTYCYNLAKETIRTRAFQA